MLLDRLRYRMKLARLSSLTRAVLRDKLTYLSLDKLQRIEAALRETSGVPGDLLEFGIALGGSGIILAANCGPGRRFVGFDVFSMIPAPTSDKDDEKSRDRYEVIAAGKSEGIGGNQYYGYREDLLSDVMNAFARHRVPVDGQSIVLHKGLFEETWDQAGVERIALAHIDCDWYDPVRFCLQSCADKMQPGGIVIIDDYNDYGGCRTAVEEFLAARPDFRFRPGPNPFLQKLR